jgi:hypothetical protein
MLVTDSNVPHNFANNYVIAMIWGFSNAFCSTLSFQALAATILINYNITFAFRGIQRQSGR